MVTHRLRMQHASACDASILCWAQVGDARAAAFDARAAAVAEAAGVLAGVRLTASAWVRAGVAVCEDGARTSAAQLLARPQMALGAVRAWRRRADLCCMGAAPLPNKLRNKLHLARRERTALPVGTGSRRHLPSAGPQQSTVRDGRRRWRRAQAAAG